MNFFLKLICNFYALLKRAQEKWKTKLEYQLELGLRLFSNAGQDVPIHLRSERLGTLISKKLDVTDSSDKSITRNVRVGALQP